MILLVSRLWNEIMLRSDIYRGVVIVYARVSSGGADDVDRDVRVASLTEKITHLTLMCPFL